MSKWKFVEWEIARSQVLPTLPFSLLSEALGRCRTTGRSQIYAWLITQIQNLDDWKIELSGGRWAVPTLLR